MAASMRRRILPRAANDRSSPNFLRLCHHPGVTTAAALLTLPDVLAGRYRPLGTVGRGAIAEVVRARDERTGEEVALKILYPHLGESAAVVERFRREVAIVRRVGHPHVLRIRDVVEADGHLFLVMDFHPGGDLADLLARRRRLPADELRALAGQLAGALAAAHRAGVVHRDVKPSNVLVGPGPALDVRLCDFGLARTAEASGLTTANAVLGTPEYMAPEVITDGHADPRSDIYSLGVVLFEAATGRLPFTGDSPYQLMRGHVDAEPPRARTFAPELPLAFDDAIARALAKDPLDRFATVEDLARAFEDRAPAAGTASLTPPRLAGTTRRSCPRCGGWVVAAAATCADCGARLLRLERPRRGGVRVVVTGPGKPGDRMDATTHVALYKLLDELPAGTVRLGRGRRRAPRLPFYVASGITRASAVALGQRLAALGLTGEFEEGAWKGRRRMLRKVWLLSWRYLAAFGTLSINTFWIHLMPKSWGLLGYLAFQVGLPATMLGTAAVAIAARNASPLVSLRSRLSRSDDFLAPLAQVMPRLASRQDRRLVGQIIERLEQIEMAGQAEVAAPLAQRAARVAAAIAELDQRRAHDAAVPADPALALAELRREERTRVVLRADLLRAASRLFDFGLALARAEAAGASEQAARLDQELGDLALALEAEEEIDLLLEVSR
jgi:hypothetical protein